MKTILLLLAITFACTVDAQNCIPNTSSISFTGTSTYVSLATNNNLNLTDSLTIEAWVNSDAWGLTSAKNSIVCKHGWSSGEEGFVLRAGGTGELSFNIACDSAGIPVSWREVVSTTGVLQLNTWHHVAATFNGMEMKIYVDATLVGTHNFGAMVSIVPSPDYSLKIGKLADDSQPETRYWSGLIDEVRIWHRVLDQPELAQNMSQHIDASAAVDLVGYWRFNDNSGTTVTDLGTGNNSGTIMSGSWSQNVPFNNGPAVPLISQAPPFLFSSATSGNQWYLDGNIIPGATGTGYQPLVNGSYTVTVSDSNGCSQTSSPVIITTLSIQDLNVQHFLLQSGDINGKLFLGLPATELAESSLFIFDAVGRIIINLNRGEVSPEISLENINPGTYFISLTTKDKNYTEKILVH